MGTEYILEVTIKQNNLYKDGGPTSVTRAVPIDRSVLEEASNRETHRKTLGLILVELGEKVAESIIFIELTEDTEEEEL